MAWGARLDEGKWRLCFRKGKTITEASVNDDKVEIVFKNQKVAKACADLLNEKYWDSYNTAQKGKTYFSAQERKDMIADIRSFQ